MTSEICFVPTKNQAKPVQPSAITASSSVSHGQFSVPFLGWNHLNFGFPLNRCSFKFCSTKCWLLAAVWSLHSVYSCPWSSTFVSKGTAASHILVSTLTVFVCVGCVERNFDVVPILPTSHIVPFMIFQYTKIWMFFDNTSPKHNVLNLINVVPFKVLVFAVLNILKNGVLIFFSNLQNEFYLFWL